MSRSMMRCALGAGALCLTATAISPAGADAAQVSVTAKRLNIQAGSRSTVKGRLDAPGRVKLQIQRRGRWVTIDRDRTDARNRFVLRGRVRIATSARARVRTSTGATRRLGRLNVYRHALASWYGPGLFGNRLGCGGRLRLRLRTDGETGGQAHCGGARIAAESALMALAVFANHG